jgi:DNA-binding transcriptional regulator YbjK
MAGMGRRDEVLDAAIAVLGTQGVRGLTHRAVDAAAGAPAGTTSNHFRTRDALFDGIVDRFAERERAALPGDPPGSPAGLAEALATFAVTATTGRRDVTLARFALLVEAANRPHLQRKLGETAAGVTGWAVDWARAAGSRHPERDAALLGAQMDAMVLHQLAYPDPGFDPAAALTALIGALFTRPGSR